MKIDSSADLSTVNTKSDRQDAVEIRANGPVELDLNTLKFVAGGLPRSGWGSAAGAIVELPRSGW